MEVTGGLQALAACLRDCLADKTAVLGIGNPLREDDGIGPYFASLLSPHPNLLVYDCGQTPENYAGKVLRERPRHVILVDAVDFGAAPGEAALFDAADLHGSGVSTHTMSLEVFAQALRGAIEDVQVRVLAFQPGARRTGHPVSPQLQRGAREVAALLSPGGWNDALI